MVDENGSTWGVDFQFWVSICFFCLYLSLPIYVTFKMCMNGKKMQDRDVLATFGAFYEGQKKSKERKRLIQPFTFYIRRLILVILVVKWAQISFVLQMMMMLGSSIFFTVISLVFDTYKSASDRRMGLYHEMTILLVSYCFLIFNVTSVESNFLYGYGAIGIVSVYCGVALLVLIRDGYLLLRMSCRKRAAIKKFRKKRKRLQRFLKMNHARTKKRMENLRKPKPKVAVRESDSSQGS